MYMYMYVGIKYIRTYVGYIYVHVYIIMWRGILKERGGGSEGGRERERERNKVRETDRQDTPAEQ